MNKFRSGKTVVQILYSMTFTLLWTMLACTTAIGQQIFINEFMASNSSTIADGADFDDWVELYNAGNSPVNIGGMYLTDDLAEPTQWQIPTNNAGATTIPAGGYLLLWFDGEPEQGPLHVDAKLGSSGEDIGLYASNGSTQIDAYTFGPQLDDISEGRSPNGSGNFDFFSQPTPGASNNTTPGGGIAPTPTFSVRGGIYNSTRSVSLSASSGTIYYTLDGSEPTQSSTRYTGSISINTNTPLRARTFNVDDAPSPVVTQTYLFNISHDLPIVAYTADPDEMFDPAIGIYPNFLEDIEIEANVELYERNGTQAFNQIFESEIQGTGSASLAQKSLAIKAKSSLGSDIIPYRVFPDLPFEELRSLTFRNSGQDWNITMFRDAYASSLVADISDVGNIIDEPNLDTQGFRPSILYLNGEYWGIHNIRERVDKRYLKTHFDLEDDEVDFLENQNEVKEGSIDAWNSLTQFVQNNPLSSSSNFNVVADQVDIDHYIDYIAFNVYIDNHDWPENNNSRWREIGSDNKWRWIIKDLDFTLGMFVRNQFNTGAFDANSLRRMLNDNGFQWPASSWSTLLFRRLMSNQQFKADFVNRMADQMNTLYDPSRMTQRLDNFVELYDSEIQEHHDRWSSGFQVWDQNVQKVRGFANGRRAQVRNHIVSDIAEVSGTTNISVSLNPSNRGQVELSTINIDGANNGWSGVYFRGIDVPVRAFPNRGYILDFWSGSVSGSDPVQAVNFSGSNNSITANFRKGSTSTQPIVINEINYNSPDDNYSADWVELHNPGNSAVNIEGWYFEDEGGDFFAIPKNTSIPAGGYLVLVEEEEAFKAIYPNVTNYIGEFGLGEKGFGLSGGGEEITLKNADGTLIDRVDYDDKAPWPTEADGDGPTLQLNAPNLDNAQASSWRAAAGTPGRANGGTTGGSQNQTISFANISDKTTSSGPFTISATASSGLPVSFRVLSGPATISNNTVSLTGNEGTVQIQASQAGNAQWNAAPNVTRTFTVSEEPTQGGCATYSATGNSIILNGLSTPRNNVIVFRPDWSIAFSCSDNCNTQETISNLSEGRYFINIKQSTATYQQICSIEEYVEVTGGNTGPANQTISFASISDKQTNDGDFSVSATATSGLPVSFRILSGPATISNNRISLTGAEGTVSVQARQAGNAQWNAAPNVTRTFTVSAAPTQGGCSTISSTSNSITLNGLSAPHNIVKIFRPDWSIALDCNDNCSSQERISNLSAGRYFVNVKQYNSSYQPICSIEEYVEVTGGGGNPPPPPAPTPTPSGDPDCSDVQIRFSGNSMVIEGLTAPIENVQVYDENYSRIFVCSNNCDDRQVINGLTPQVYHVNVQFFTSSWSTICTEDIDITFNGLDAPREERRAKISSSTNTYNEMTIYPNPVKDLLFLNVGKQKGTPLQIELFNTLGQGYIQQTMVLDGNREQAIDVSNVSKGIYFLKVTQDKEVIFTKKVVVE